MSYIYSTINHIGLVINNILSRFIRIFYTTPIVKSTLTKYGKNLLIIGPIIKLDKNIKIFIGDNCFLSTHMEIKANNNNINEL